MRIPRVAFALLLLAIAGLGSGLVIERARAQNQGAVLMMTAKMASGGTIRCAMSSRDQNKNSCALLGPKLQLAFRVASLSGEEIELGVRAKADPNAPTVGGQTFTIQALENIPEQLYSFHPGQELKIEIPGFGPMVVTGDLLDHMPPLLGMDVKTDPDPNKLQVISPILLQGKRVLHDFEGGSAMDSAVQIYVPDSGLWVFSLRPLEGAVEGRVNQNRVSFEVGKQSYTLVSGMPVARTERIWVLHDPKDVPDARGAFIGGSPTGTIPR
jgi:hypothetical protein